MDKKNLIIIRNKHNDIGSDLYLKSIRRQWKDNYQEDINLIVYRIDDQSELEKQLSIQKGQVLLLEPTNLCLPEYMSDRNAENHQTAHFVCDMVKCYREQIDTKILLVGKGLVNRKIFEELCIKSGYCCTMYGTKFDIDKEFSSQFDVIINATTTEGNCVYQYVNCDMLFDISGNFIKLNKSIKVMDGTTEALAEIKSKVRKPFSIREIGKQTVFRLLEEVKNS